ncbi:MAG: glycosyltransferase family 2 protein [Desulfobacterales bacterium]|nr:glycosyltransferase family 2 protein [Desulfobacterales bacterium]
MRSVSVVLVSFHTGPVLFKAVSSVLNQSEICQVILVDNGNPDTALNELSQCFASDTRFELLTGHGNIGFAGGCNLGVESVKGEFLLLLNPDCIIPDNDSICSLIDTANNLEGDCLLAPRLLNPDQTEQQGGRREILTPWLAFVEGTKLYKLFPNHPYFKRFNMHNQPLPTEVTEIPVTSGACMLLRTSLYRSLGGMDEGFFLHVEDIDFCMRFRKAGGRIFFCPHIPVIHTLSSSQVSERFVEWHKVKGFRRYFKKHFTGLYPAGFISLVNLAIYIRFFILTSKNFFLSLLKRPGFKKK